MVAQAEDAAPVDADPLEDPVAVQEPVVGHGQARVGALDDAAVDPDLHVPAPSSRAATFRAARFGAAFHPVRIGLERLPAVRDSLDAHCEKVGRDPSEIEVSVYNAPYDAGELTRLAEAGLARAVFILPPADADTLVPLLDQLAGLADQVG